MYPDHELWRVVRRAVDNLKTDIISQSAPYLVAWYKEEVEEILERNRKAEYKVLAESKVEELNKWLELSEESSGHGYGGGHWTSWKNLVESGYTGSRDWVAELGECTIADGAREKPTLWGLKHDLS